MKPQETEKEQTAPALPPAPWEDLYDGVSRLKVPGGWLYKTGGQIAFVPGA